MTFCRLVAPLVSHVDHPSVSNQTGFLCGMDELRDRCVHQLFYLHFPTLRPLVHLTRNPQWPNRNWNYARIHQSADSWPPRSGSGDDWIADAEIRILPKGKESLVVMAATLLPVASFRFAYLGSDYLKACVLLSGTTTRPSSISESVRSQSDLSFILVDEESL
jgi:hypothetical protein